MRRLLPGVLAAAAVLAGCDNYAPTHYAALCVDQNGYRVDDRFCAIGDPGVPVGGYGWGYAGIPQSGYFDMPLVGYQVNRAVFAPTVPNVTTINIARGDFAAAAPAGTRANSQRVPVTGGVLATSAPSSSVTRGGLGVKPQFVEDDQVAAPTFRKTTAKLPARRVFAPRPKATKR